MSHLDPPAHVIALQPNALWRHHPNGGGYVSYTARVDSTVYLGPNCAVANNASVRDTARITEGSLIYEDAIVRGSAWISGLSIVRGSATVEGSGRVSGRSIVQATSRVADNAHVASASACGANTTLRGTALLTVGTMSGGTWLTSPPQCEVEGLPCLQSNIMHILIGSVEDTIANWVASGLALMDPAERALLSPAQEAQVLAFIAYVAGP